VFPNIMKWFCTAVLLVALLSWRVSPAYELPLNIAISFGAIAVILQALNAKQYLWALGFFVIALLFNPVVPVATDAGFSYLALTAACATFALSTRALKTRPLLTIPSIMGPRGSEAL
jgi:hypothetical protein